jgi:hypothetical protein
LLNFNAQLPIWILIIVLRQILVGVLSTVHIAIPTSSLAEILTEIKLIEMLQLPGSPNCFLLFQRLSPWLRRLFNTHKPNRLSSAVHFRLVLAIACNEPRQTVSASAFRYGCTAIPTGVEFARNSCTMFAVVTAVGFFFNRHVRDNGSQSEEEGSLEMTSKSIKQTFCLSLLYSYR